MAKPKVVGTGPPKEPILYERRVSYAKRRIMSVLRYWVLAYRRELERQVCEVGFDHANAPAHQRTEPHHCSEAITVLVDEGKIEPFSIQIGNKPFQFWANSAAGEAARKAVFERKERALRVFEAVAAQPRLLGWHAESIYHKALLAAEEVWSSVGWKGGVKQYTLGRYALDLPGDIDLAGHHRETGIPFVAQVKNGREWFYPPDHEVWNLLGTASQLHAVPILIARRLRIACLAS